LIAPKRGAAGAGLFFAMKADGWRERERESEKEGRERERKKHTKG
jgi:hypothetical protein